MSIDCFTNKNLSIINIDLALKRVELNGNFILKNSQTFYHLKVLSLKNNYVVSKWPTLFIPNLFILKIIETNLKNLSIIETKDYPFLQIINVSKTNINSLCFLNRIKARNLLYLDASNTKLKVLDEKCFRQSRSLVKLYLENINFQKISGSISRFFTKVEYLHLKNTFYSPNYISDLLNNVKNLKFIEGEIYHLCCLSWKIINKNVTCSPSPSGYLTCHDIIPTNILKYFCIILGIFGFFGNVSTLVFLRKMNKKSLLYRICLTFGDLLTSIYMLTISVIDRYYSKETYLKYEEDWRYSFWCSFLGTILNFSLCLSAFAIFAISIERYESIANIFESPFMTRKRNLITGISVMICLLISLFPVLRYNNVSE